MKKNKKSFNAISTFTNLARLLDDSHSEILGIYDENLAKIPVDRKNPKIKSESERQQLLEDLESFGRFLKTTSLETLVFIAIYAYQLVNNAAADTRDITRFFGISELDFLPLKNCLPALLKKGQIRLTERHRRYDEYKISKAAETALLNNTPFKPEKEKPMDRYQFCADISDLIEMRSDDEIDTRDLFKLVEEAEENNGNLKLVKEMTKLLSSVEDRTLFYEICDDFVGDTRRRAATGLDCTLSDIYDTCRSRLNVAKSIMEKDHALIVNELVEVLPASFFGDASLALTEKGKQLFLEEDYDLFQRKGGADKRLITPEKIPTRELFFSEELNRDLNFVKNSLEDSSFVELQKRLEENSLPKGVAVLFHGLPGTGKTAAVDMIAKATGRSVYHVDIAASKTCWFGESEKLFKKIFTDYRRMCETEERKPILLFNEADALFSKRRDVDSGNCAQTENALQNILLEELETLDGILIATTNLCDNFDSAFERRFLFKVKFGQPDKAAKKAIWKSKVSWLTDEECGKLAAQFDLSGGEIDNIVRKSFMEEVLTGNRPTMEMLEAWCKGEKLHAGKGAAIGFNK